MQPKSPRDGVTNVNIWLIVRNLISVHVEGHIVKIHIISLKIFLSTPGNHAIKLL